MIRLKVRTGPKTKVIITLKRMPKSPFRHEAFSKIFYFIAEWNTVLWKWVGSDQINSTTFITEKI